MSAGYDTEARRDTPLALALKERIRRDGPITVADYMTACLQDPEHGYYRGKAVLGAQGDFITAPEISQVFGELIGLWCAVVWQQMGKPAKVNLVELGPGHGTLMQDALRAAGKLGGFIDALNVRLVESNPVLAETQRHCLERRHPRIDWQPAIGDLPDTLAIAPTIVIGNEWLDAIPTDQIVRRQGHWHDRMVGLDATGLLSMIDGRPSRHEMPPNLAAMAQDSDVFEIADFAQGAIAPLARLADRAAPVAALLIDYGHAASGLGDTLQAVRNHRAEPIFESPGEADLSVQVDFAALTTTARTAGLRVDGPVTQAEFLGGLGIIERASKLMAANPAQAGVIEAGIARLLAPNGMGTRFKAIGLRSKYMPPLPGFPPQP